MCGTVYLQQKRRRGKKKSRGQGRITIMKWRTYDSVQCVLLAFTALALGQLPNLFCLTGQRPPKRTVIHPSLSPLFPHPTAIPRTPGRQTLANRQRIYPNTPAMLPYASRCSAQIYKYSRHRFKIQPIVDMYSQTTLRKSKR